MKTFFLTVFCLFGLFFLSRCKKKEATTPPAADAFISELDGLGNMILLADGRFCLTRANGSGISLYFTDTSGKVLSSKSYPMEVNGYEDVRAAQDKSGNIILYSKATEIGKGDTYTFMRCDAQGNSQLTKKILLPLNTFSASITALTDGYLLTGGIFDSVLIYRDVFLMKINTDLDTVWTRNYGSISNDVGMKSKELCDGNIGVLAYSDFYGAGSRDFWYMKLDKNGDTLKTVTFGSTGYEEPQDMVIDNDCNVILAGHTASFGHPEHNAYLVKCSPEGSLIWQNNYGSIDHDGFHAVNLYDNGNKIISVARSTTTNSSTKQEDNLIVFTDKAGNQLDTLRVGVPLYDDVPLNVYVQGKSYFLFSKYLKGGNTAFSFFKGQVY